MDVIKPSEHTHIQPSNNKGIALAIGNFDGCHFGHKVLFDACVASAKSLDLKAAVLTFAPHPQFYFQNTPPKGLIQTNSLKTEICADMGFDILFEQAFDDGFASMSHKEFVESYLVGKLNAKVIITGFNFRFGKQRLGNTDYIEDRAEELGYKYKLVEPQELGGQVVSSTRIRELIGNDGDIALATKLLTRPYCYEQVVSHGNKLGRKLNFPTANLVENNQVTPKAGVYIAYASIKNGGKYSKNYRAVVNIGYRPTVEGKPSNLMTEVHIFDDNFDSSSSLYQKLMRVHYLDRIRDEMKFNNLDELRCQISLDVKEARRYFDTVGS